MSKSMITFMIHTLPYGSCKATVDHPTKLVGKFRRIPGQGWQGFCNVLPYNSMLGMKACRVDVSRSLKTLYGMKQIGHICKSGSRRSIPEDSPWSFLVVVVVLSKIIQKVIGNNGSRVMIKPPRFVRSTFLSNAVTDQTWEFGSFFHVIQIMIVFVVEYIKHYAPYSQNLQRLLDDIVQRRYIKGVIVKLLDLTLKLLLGLFLIQTFIHVPCDVCKLGSKLHDGLHPSQFL
mmetsp:Transcript_28069/g.52668  ORF Transcript_28069/g.52668 Transcript_28069/m.52668 type:complete len:231 (-) Transcript_28069:223-915(-)